MDQQYGPGAGGFGLVGAGVVVLFVLLAWVAIRVARGGPPFRTLWARVSETLTWARDRISDRGWSLARRWSESEVAGAALLFGLAVVVALAVGFSEILEDVLEGDGIVGIDQPVTRWLAAHRELWLTAALRAVTVAGGPLFLAAIAFPISVAAGYRSRSWRPVVLALVGGGGVPLVLFTAKALVGRPRPPLPFALVDADGYSFPSGHATGTAAVVVISAWMLTRWLIMRWTGRVIVWTVAIGSAFLIGFSRIYLGVHYVSDVLSGWMLGLAWAGTVMLVGTWWDDVRRARGTRPR
ncbi:phosphatidic acid phosphatase [Mycobacterium paraffinicum]|uniref:Phosphatidic acid phosphatase n=1 Tax=Mycobacterium paraffinicum TaxID=53378 RepID=A0A1Q4HRQ2_9MYCO|nr:phosphatase PAP2 family protein [Mycobacterium paraffinicum]OJZ71646.1 phosphatidic acid phosphatase [Mycobacterium paraffinicum]